MKFKVRRYRKLWRNLAFMGVLVAILVTSVVLGMRTRSERLKSPEASLPALTSQLKQVVLVADSLGNTPGVNSSAYNHLSSQQATYQSSLDGSKKLLEVHKGKLDESTYTKISQLLDNHQRLLNGFDGRFKTLAKVIAYNPSLDLGESKITEQYAQELATRANATQSGLNYALQTARWQLQDDTKNALNKAANCFGQLSEQLKTHKLAEATTSRQRCVDIYELVTRTAVLEVTSAFKTTQAAVDTAELSSVTAKLPAK